MQVYGSRAKPCKEYLCKGHPALVEGRLREYTWERDGVKHRHMEDETILIDVSELAGKYDLPEDVTRAVIEQAVYT